MIGARQDCLISPKELVLGILLEGDNYAGGIRSHVEKRVRATISTARVYGALQRLEREGVVRRARQESACDAEGRPRSGRLRVYYELTPTGRAYAALVQAQNRQFYGESHA